MRKIKTQKDVIIGFPGPFPPQIIVKVLLCGATLLFSTLL